MADSRRAGCAPEVFEEVLDPPRPVVCELIFPAEADRVADLGLVDGAGDRRAEAGTHVADRCAACEIGKPRTELVAEAGANRPNDLVLGCAVRGAIGQRRSAEPCPVDIAEDSVHQVPALPIVADGRACHATGDVEIAGRHWTGGPARGAPGTTAIDAKIRAVPVPNARG